MPVRRNLRSIFVLLGMAILFLGLSSPATAHKEHKKQPAAQVVQPGTQPAAPTAPTATGHENMPGIARCSVDGDAVGAAG